MGAPDTPDAFPLPAAQARLPEHRRLDVEPGDELIFQLFYRPEDAPEAYAQDAQYGAMLDVKTFGHAIRWSARDLRDGILERLRAER